jgi:hypothetical protein
MAIDKNLIMEAWARYRPANQVNNERRKTRKRDIKIIYGEQFI